MGKAKDWKSLLSYIENISYSKSYGPIFRGQSNSEWKLEPSITRIVNGSQISQEKALGYEAHAFFEFVSQYELFKDIGDFNIENDYHGYIAMQHFSCPTRLLDWSRSPYVALYFAVNENFNVDGVLYVFSDLINDRNIEEHFPHYEIPKGHEVKDFKEFDLVKLVFGTKHNRRTLNQQGVFTISNNILRNHCEIIEQYQNDDYPALVKIIIPKELKIEILSRLRIMNISPNSLFPGLDGVGRSVRESLILRRDWEKK